MPSVATTPCSVKRCTLFQPMIRTILYKYDIPRHPLTAFSSVPDNTAQWPRWKKDSVLVICSLYSFFAESCLTGSSVYIGLLAKTFHVSPAVASQTSR